MRTDLVDHPLVGAVVDFDWRKDKEKHLPYDRLNLTVDQDVEITAVKLDCHGDAWCYSDKFAAVNIKRVINIRYES